MFSKPRSTFALLNEAFTTARLKIAKSSCTTASTEQEASFVSFSSIGKVQRHARVGIDLYRLACHANASVTEGFESCHSERLLSLRGTVLRSSNIKSRVAKKPVECANCGYRFLLECGTKEGSAHVPSRCPSHHVMSNGNITDVKPCDSTTFRSVNAVQPFLSDFQEIQVQLQGVSRQGRVTLGYMWDLDEFLVSATDVPRDESQVVPHEEVTVTHTLQVVLPDILVEKCRVGDEVCLSVMFHWQWCRAVRRQQADIKVVCLANAIFVISENESVVQSLNDVDVENFASFWRYHSPGPAGFVKIDRIASGRAQGRDIILRSVYSDLSELHAVKLAILLTLIGGVQQTNRCSVNNIRSDCHLLIVGDSGTGKSCLLRYISKLATRAIVVNGAASTLAGMSAMLSISGDEKNCSYEAGALTMANGGICCIDQFHLIGYQARAVIHEAMEQQTVSIAKGKTIATIQARCSIIGAAAAKGIKYNTTPSVAFNTGLAASMLSRFDCIMVIHDAKQSLADEALSSHLIALHGHVHAQAKNTGWSNFPDKASLRWIAGNRSSHFSDDIKDGVLTPTAQESYRTKKKSGNMITDAWPFDSIRKYISLVRCALDPMLSPDAESLIRGYYQLCRCEMSGPVRPTIRLLESLVRLSQAHAKLVWRFETVCQDVAVAVHFSEMAKLGSQQDTTSSDFFAIPTLKEAMKCREIQLVQQIREKLGPMWWK